MTKLNINVHSNALVFLWVYKEHATFCACNLLIFTPLVDA